MSPCRRCALNAPFHRCRGQAAAVSFLCHFPSGRPARTLSGIVPYGARTFLSSPRGDQSDHPTFCRRECSTRGVRLGNLVRRMARNFIRSTRRIGNRSGYAERLDTLCSEVAVIVPHRLRLLVVSVLLSVAGCGGSGEARTGFHAALAASGLTGPTAIAFAADGRLFICEKAGAVKVLVEGQSPKVALTLNVATSLEQGVSGIALDPDFATNRRLYVYYTANALSLSPPPSPSNRVSRFTMTGDVIDPASETILLQDIASVSGTHNAGCLRFGEDGKLYIATGDGGVPASAQDLGSLNGKILRINRDGSVPGDNPFVGQAAKRAEVYAYGLRNPFRFTFRPGDNALVIGDVGQDTWEEVNVGGAGANFGWPLHEGPSSDPAFVSPTYAYNHNSRGASITGGVFLIGSNYPEEYRGRYFFADFMQYKLNHVAIRLDNTVSAVEGFGSAEGLSSLGGSVVDIEQGPNGDLYLVDYLSGVVHRISFTDPP